MNACYGQKLSLFRVLKLALLSHHVGSPSDLILALLTEGGD